MRGVAQPRVLNVGSGPDHPKRLHPVFKKPRWQEIRLDIDPAVKPDIIGSVVDLTSLVPDESFDAVFSSHSLEHLFSFEVSKALAEIRRVLKLQGFALITCPDLMQVAQRVVAGQLEEVAYQSSAGPVTALDMLYGHGIAIERGNTYMAHHNGFTVDRLGRLLATAGFHEAWVMSGQAYDLWAVALMPRTNADSLTKALFEVGLDFTSRDEG